MRTITVRQFAEPRDYHSVWDDMRAFTERRDSHTRDELWLLQHAPVITLGQAARIDHLHNSCDFPVIHSDRGGQVTYHGPGQLVGYVLLDLHRRRLAVRHLVRLLEQSAINVLSEYDVSGYSRQDAPGVYVRIASREHKIAAVGLRVRRGRCYHGLALNVNMDLSPFSRMNPCGFAGLPVTQLADLSPGPVEWQTVTGQLSRHLTSALS